MAMPLVDRLTPGDLDAMMPIERVAFHQPWSRHMYLMDMTQNNLATYLVLRPGPGDEGRLPAILAYGGLWRMLDEGHIATIASHPDYRGCGLGHSLLLALIDAGLRQGIVRSTLEVRVSNHVAQALYAQVGYEVVGERRRYYQDGENALIMTTPPLQEPVMQARLEVQRRAAAARLAHCFLDGVGPER